MAAERRRLIFVNYRGGDQIWAVELVYARMAEAFGADAVFKAGNAISIGEDFPPALRRHAASCPVMLVCIGPGWLDAGGPAARSLDREDDWVRREIAITLRAGNHLVPLLIGNHDQVSIPAQESLPEEIRDLVRRQAWRLAPGAGLDLTVPGLVARLAEMVPELAERRRQVAEASDARQPFAAGEEGSALTTFRQDNIAHGDATVFAVQHGDQHVDRKDSGYPGAPPNRADG